MVKKTQVTLHQTAFIIGQPVGVFPQRDIGGHVDFLRHPVIGAAGQILFPRPLVLEWNQLVHVRAAVDDALVFHADPAGAGGSDGIVVFVRLAFSGGAHHHRKRHGLCYYVTFIPSQHDCYLPSPCRVRRLRTLTRPTLLFSCILLLVSVLLTCLAVRTVYRARTGQCAVRHRVQRAVGDGGLLGVRRAQGTQVIGGLDAAQPGELV